MTAIASPTVTGYKRYRLGTWAPVQVAWGIQNRTALVRALPDGADTRIENRLGSSDANPYLLTAVMVAAGLDGVRQGLEPPDPSSDNLFLNIRFQRLPASPPEGIDALLADDALVQALGPVFTSTFTDVLRFDWAALPQSRERLGDQRIPGKLKGAGVQAESTITAGTQADCLGRASAVMSPLRPVRAEQRCCRCRWSARSGLPTGAPASARG